MKVAIMGAGAFGTALGGVLADNGYDIDYYDPKLEHESLDNVLRGAKMILLAIPSVAVPHFLPHLPKNLPLIIATKGMLDGKPFQRFDDIMIVSGPGFAEDIKSGKETFLTVTDERIAEMLKADYMRFDYTDDEAGVLLCGSLKNVYAMMAGLKDLQSGSAQWNKYIKEVADEMKEILVANGARRETVDLVCGIGDLKLTCDFPSRNYQYGQQLRSRRSFEPDNTVEGLTALRKIRRGEIRLPENVPIMNEIMRKIR